MYNDVMVELKKNSRSYGSVLIEKYPLRDAGTIGLGGAADVFYCPRTLEELEKAVFVLRSSGTRFFILGNGSNVLFDDDGFEGVVISMAGFSDFQRQRGMKLALPSGIRLPALMRVCMSMGLSGIEKLSGIPATLGGAVRNNASSGKFCITDVLERILVLDERGKITWVCRGDMTVGYRRSLWPGNGIILSAVINLIQSTSIDVKDRIRQAFTEKFKKQPCDKKTLGCVFKNPAQGKTAWELIDVSGFRGIRVGGLSVSQKHANFIINDGSGTSNDFKELVGRIKYTVNERCSIMLEEEIEVVDAVF